MEVSDADRRKEWSTNQSGMTQTVGTDADIIGVPRSVLAAACHIIRNSEHAESETAKAMRKYALSTQAAELDALRGEVERLNAIYHSPTGDNHHNAARCPYCRPEYEQDHATIAQLRDRVAGLEEGVSDLLPRGVCWDNPNIPDDTVLPIDMTMGEIRKARALLTQNEVG